MKNSNLKNFTTGNDDLKEYQETNIQDITCKYCCLSYFHLSEELSQGGLFDKYPDFKVPKSLDEAEALLILRLITQQAVIDISRGIYQINSGFIILDEQYLYRIGMTSYKKYIEYFLKCGIIEQTTYNLFKTSQKGIRISDQYIKKYCIKYKDFSTFLDKEKEEEKDIKIEAAKPEKKIDEEY